MAHDEGLAQRIRELLVDRPAMSEKKMFGGLSFMLHGNMCCGVAGDDLMARVGPDQYEEALGRPHARPMDFTGKPLKGFVYVNAKGYDADADLQGWIDLAVRFVDTLPAKD